MKVGGPIQLKPNWEKKENCFSNWTFKGESPIYYLIPVHNWACILLQSNACIMGRDMCNREMVL